MPRDKDKANERQRRYREREKIRKYGPDSIGVSMIGRHGNHARGSDNGRWNSAERRITSSGYVALRSDPSHPRAWGPKTCKQRYIYEHHVVAEEMLGRPLHDDEVVHHQNGDRADNRPENLHVMSRTEHAREHANADGIRDELGRFVADRPRHSPKALA